jgi:cell wall-associated NlpC family hydrolase
MILVFSCSLKEELPEAFLEDIANADSQFAPDKRTKVFQIDYHYDQEENRWMITGETSEPQLLDTITGLVDTYFNQDEVVLDLQLLPHSALKDTIYGLVNVSVGNLRKHPKHSAELVDQALMGTVLKILKKKSYWYLVQTSTEYLGWITRGTVTEMTESELHQWQNQDQVMLKVNFAQIFSQASTNSQVICDAVLGCVFKVNSRHGVWQEVSLPDGRSGFIAANLVTEPVTIDNSKYPAREDVITLAKTMLGVPYLWGGNSTKAFDCSGFTCTIYSFLGYQLPRDANMQVEIGQDITPDSDYSNLLPGDLIFFGPENRITHVGICLGDSYFIHSSNDVHINSLGEQDDLYDPYRKRTFKRIKRIIKS